MRSVSLISRLDAHHRLLLTVGITVITGLLLPRHLLTQTRVVVRWVVFAFTTLVLVWTAFLVVHPRQTSHLSQIQDSGRRLIFVFILGSAVGSIGAVLALLVEVKTCGTMKSTAICSRHSRQFSAPGYWSTRYSRYATHICITTAPA